MSKFVKLSGRRIPNTLAAPRPFYVNVDKVLRFGPTPLHDGSWIEMEGETEELFTGLSPEELAGILNNSGNISAGAAA